MEPDFCIQVGDYWNYNHIWSVPVYWMFGNHERGEDIKRVIDGSFKHPTNSHWLMGGIEEINGVRVMALPGLPQVRPGPGPANYPPKVYELCMQQAGEDVDIFASHGCGFPFPNWVFDSGHRKSIMKNLEEPDITRLIKQVQPTYAVSGHNHKYAVEEHSGICCIRLGHTEQSGGFAHIVEFER